MGSPVSPFNPPPLYNAGKVAPSISQVKRHFLEKASSFSECHQRAGDRPARNVDNETKYPVLLSAEERRVPGHLRGFPSAVCRQGPAASRPRRRPASRNAKTVRHSSFCGKCQVAASYNLSGSLSLCLFLCLFLRRHLQMQVGLPFILFLNFRDCFIVFRIIFKVAKLNLRTSRSSSSPHYFSTPKK